MNMLTALSRLHNILLACEAASDRESAWQQILKQAAALDRVVEELAPVFSTNVSTDVFAEVVALKELYGVLPGLLHLLTAPPGSLRHDSDAQQQDPHGGPAAPTAAVAASSAASTSQRWHLSLEHCAVVSSLCTVLSAGLWTAVRHAVLSPAATEQSLEACCTSRLHEALAAVLGATGPQSPDTSKTPLGQPQLQLQLRRAHDWCTAAAAHAAGSLLTLTFLLAHATPLAAAQLAASRLLPLACAAQARLHVSPPDEPRTRAIIECATALLGALVTDLHDSAADDEPPRPPADLAEAQASWQRLAAEPAVARTLLTVLPQRPFGDGSAAAAAAAAATTGTAHRSSGAGPPPPPPGRSRYLSALTGWLTAHRQPGGVDPALAALRLTSADVAALAGLDCDDTCHINLYWVAVCLLQLLPYVHRPLSHGAFKAVAAFALRTLTPLVRGSSSSSSSGSGSSSSSGSGSQGAAASGVGGRGGTGATAASSSSSSSDLKADAPQDDVAANAACAAMRLVFKFTDAEEGHECVVQNADAVHQLGLVGLWEACLRRPWPPSSCAFLSAGLGDALDCAASVAAALAPGCPPLPPPVPPLPPPLPSPPPQCRRSSAAVSGASLGCDLSGEGDRQRRALQAYVSLAATARKCVNVQALAERTCSDLEHSLALAQSASFKLLHGLAMSCRRLSAAPAGGGGGGGGGHTAAATSPAALVAMRCSALQLLPPLVQALLSAVTDRSAARHWPLLRHVAAELLLPLHEAGCADVTAAAGAPALLLGLMRGFRQHSSGGVAQASDVAAVTLHLMGAARFDGKRAWVGQDALLQEASACLAMPGAPAAVHDAVQGAFFMGGGGDEVRHRGWAQDLHSAPGTPGDEPYDSGYHRVLCKMARQLQEEAAAEEAERPEAMSPGWDSLLLAASASGGSDPGSRPLVGCWHRGCTNLEGRSEAELPVRLCSGCRVARYCSPACQRQAWTTGHRGACGAWQKQAAASAATATDMSVLHGAV